MPSNDDLKHQNEGEATKGRASGDASVASVLPDDHTAGADETSANEAGINETSADEAFFSSDHGMPQEFTFFKKRNVQIKRFWPHLWLMPAPRR